MNQSVKQLAAIASKKSRMIIGLMSGTSLDGLDVALCKVKGHGLKTSLELLQFDTVSYTDTVKARIQEVFARPQVNFEKLCLLNVHIAQWHAAMINRCLKRWKVPASKVDAIASHGQTVFHTPGFLHPHDPTNATMQIGDGDHLAAATGIITLSDFRQKHIAKGGEGAPLAVYGDYLLLSSKRENRILLNIGGIGNFTFLPKGRDAKKVFVTDTGPGNTLIDQAVRRYCPGEYYDKDAARARAGTIHEFLLEMLKADPFFALPFPKTTGPELFNLDFVYRAQQKAQAVDIPLNDLLATLTRFSAETMVEAIQKAAKKNTFEIYLSGGGAHNPLLAEWLQGMLGVKTLRTTDALGVPGDAKEAVLFAILANETLAGGNVDFGSRAKIPSVCLGKISFPD